MHPMMLRFAGLGDDLFVNTIAYHSWRESGSKVFVAGNHRDLFRGNPGAWIIPTSSQKIAHQLGRFLIALGIVKSMTYMGYQEENNDKIMKPMEAHILKVLAEKAGLKKTPKKTEIFLSDNEKKKFSLPLNGKPWVAMHSTGVTEMTENKNWYPERFLEVSQNIRSFARVVQLGRLGDPELDVDLDLRGRITPRQAAAVLVSCSALVCQVGYLMHAAAAVRTKAVVVYGGFEAPWESGYEENVNLFTKLHCSPCWITGQCPYNKKCMDKISVDDVCLSIKKIIF
jgi:ADP-heptose:LPS heptosyltransferase